MAVGQDNAPTFASLKLRRRRDLEIYPQRRRSQRVWVIKDPLSLRYYQFREEEYRILQWLDGRSTLAQLKDRFEQSFAPRRMTQPHLHAFVAHLHRNGLVLSDAPGQGEQLRKRFDRQRHASLLESLTNPLAIRFRGLNPERLLSWLYPKLSWVFSRSSAVACIAIVLTALTLLWTRFDIVQERLPELNLLLSPSNLILLAITMALIKLLHELGHALACKHYGGHCHELGVMLLVFTPCLYCNVTDAWKLSSRWQRMAISAAGIIVEVVLAAVCTILWFYSQPGLFNTLCLNVMVVCSVGTVLLNGNPLLRYDGYYLLSDLLDLPNLWQDSRRCIHRLASRALLGIDIGKPVSRQSRPGLLIAYASASMAYRTLVMFSIMYLVYRVCKPEGLLLVAQILTAFLLVGIFSSPVTAVSRIMSNPAMRRQVKPRRVLMAVAVTSAILAACFLVPLPCRIAAPVVIESHDARRVYVTVPGRLTRSVEVGQSVSKGEPLAYLENIEIRRELEQVRGQLNRQQLRVKNLESLRGDDATIAAQLPAAKEILSDLRRRLAQLETDESDLVLTAPIDGTVLPPPSQQSVASDELQLASWSGTPMDAWNLGMTLERKTLFCLIGLPDSDDSVVYEAAVYIDQSDVQYVQPDQTVHLLFEIGGGNVVSGRIREISRVNLQSVPSELAVDQQISNRLDSSGVRRPEQTSYKAQVRLDPTDVPMLIGARGRAKIQVQGQPLSQRIYRMLSRTFKPVI